MSNKKYDVLKYVALIGLPAIATLIGTLGEIWGLQNADQIVLTINACAVMLGSLLQVSSNAYHKQNGK
ncbi:phage holin [Ignavigranum ruoffiae]|uniref:phage holin n=1 Tax=Ignavigranum ruoffiae TaxID=89093 RepID=UPI0020495783|nr:phage holin [Ignavigranum ruoffiae]UPQ86441.1 phage holin [Ignavigranum ruoffiae]